jgi:arginine deiminase
MAIRDPRTLTIINVRALFWVEHSLRAPWLIALENGEDMARSGTIIAVSDDVGVLRDALVQGPVCDPLGARTESAGSEVAEAATQHRRLVRALETAGVTVRHLDALLHSALGFADARDWILERRLAEVETETGADGGIIFWLSEQPADALTRFLMEGMQLADLPAGLRGQAHGAANGEGWLIAPLDDATHPRSRLRVINGGVLLSQPEQRQSRAASITAATVLNFAPLFDQSRFEFWLTADGADRSSPPVAGNDIAMPSEGVCVGAITRNTSVQALSLLAASLFRQNRVSSMFWLDLTGTGCDCLDDCFLPLSRDCLLVDMRLLETASAFGVRANHRGAVLGIEPCGSSFVKDLARRMEATKLHLIDIRQHPRPVADALAMLAPIVLSPGRIIAFEEHEAGFRVLEQHGVEIVSCFPGAALSPHGKGPRGLLAALHAV